MDNPMSKSGFTRILREKYSGQLLSWRSQFCTVQSLEDTQENNRKQCSSIRPRIQKRRRPSSDFVQSSQEQTWCLRLRLCPGRSVKGRCLSRRHWTCQERVKIQRGLLGLRGSYVAETGIQSFQEGSDSFQALGSEAVDYGTYHWRNNGYKQFHRLFRWGTQQNCGGKSICNIRRYVFSTRNFRKAWLIRKKVNFNQLAGQGRKEYLFMKAEQVSSANFFVSA